MTKCPDCRKYDCECEPNQSQMPWIESKTSEESSEPSKIPKPLRMMLCKPEEIEIPCPRCGGTGSVPNMILCAEDPCFPCGGTGGIWVRENPPYEYK